MAETEVSPPPAPVAEEVVAEGGGVAAAESGTRRDGKPERPRRELEEIPDMTVEEAHKALNALPKVRGGTEQYNMAFRISMIGVFGSTLSGCSVWRGSRGGKKRRLLLAMKPRGWICKQLHRGL